MNKNFNKNKFYLHPIFLISLGSIIGVMPGILPSNPIFLLYRSFTASAMIYVIYALGFIAFCLGYIIGSLAYRRKENQFKIKRVDNKVIFTFLILMWGILLINIRTYGGIPLFQIIKGANISFVNQAQQNSQTGGLFGIQVMLNYILLLLLQPQVIYLSIEKLKSSRTTRILYYLHILTILFTCTYTGKRQFLFIALTMLSSYIWVYIIRYREKPFQKKVKKMIARALLIVFLIFSLVGILRENISHSILLGLFLPVAVYATLPFMNLTNIILHQQNNHFAFSWPALWDNISFGLPSLFRGDSSSLQIIPLVEKTSPNTVYGNIFWNFKYAGIFIFMMLVGILSAKLYKNALGGKRVNVAIFSIIVWPLLSIHTYNHFINTMYFLIPLLLAVITDNFFLKKIKL